MHINIYIHILTHPYNIIIYKYTNTYTSGDVIASRKILEKIEQKKIKKINRRKKA